LRRGDVVIVALPGGYGKPRPAVVVQSDLLSERSEGVILCPATSVLLDIESTRPTLRATSENGLRSDTQVMSDKIHTVNVRRIGQKIGRVSAEDLERIDFSLRLVLGLLD